MRCRECLMKIQVHDIEAHVSRTNDSEKRVHIGSVIIEETAASVDEVCNLTDFLLEKTESIRVGHHDTCDIITEKRLEVSDIHKTIFLGLHDNDVKTADCSTCRVRTMSTVRNYHLRTFCISTKQVILPHDHKTCQLAMGTCTRVKCKA